MSKVSKLHEVPDGSKLPRSTIDLVVDAIDNAEKCRIAWFNQLEIRREFGLGQARVTRLEDATKLLQSLRRSIYDDCCGNKYGLYLIDLVVDAIDNAEKEDATKIVLLQSLRRQIAELRGLIAELQGLCTDYLGNVAHASSGLTNSKSEGEAQ